MKFAGWLVAAVVLLSGGQQPDDLPPRPTERELTLELELEVYKEALLDLRRQQAVQPGSSKDAPLYVSVVPSKDGVPVDIRNWPNRSLQVNEMRPDGSYRP